jgi:hypothetical protein
MSPAATGLSLRTCQPLPTMDHCNKQKKVSNTNSNAQVSSDEQNETSQHLIDPKLSAFQCLSIESYEEYYKTTLHADLVNQYE